MENTLTKPADAAELKAIEAKLTRLERRLRNAHFLTLGEDFYEAVIARSLLNACHCTGQTDSPPEPPASVAAVDAAGRG